MELPEFAVVIPAFNEERAIGGVLSNLKTLAPLMIVVDDGSSDRTGEIAKSFGAVVLRHEINRGLGASLQTGFRKALELGSEYVVTMDADGQHRASDVPRLLEALRERNADMVIGARVFRSAPAFRRIYNFIANLVSYFLLGVRVSDTQSGLRAFRAELLKKMRILGDRMEISSELVGEARRLGAKIIEIPIEPIYTSYSLSKGQSFTMG